MLLFNVLSAGALLIISILLYNLYNVVYLPFFYIPAAFLSIIINIYRHYIALVVSGYIIPSLVQIAVGPSENIYDPP
jgi:hypothetical protein